MEAPSLETTTLTVVRVENHMKHHPASTGSIITSSIITSLLLIPVALAASLSLQGSVKTQGNLPSNLRVGVLLIDRSGRPTGEVGSGQIQSNTFSLNVPETAPAANAMVAATPDALDWPGLIGKITLTGTARIAQASLRAYGDADKTQSFTAGDTALESFVTKSRGGIVIVYSDAKLRIQGEKGFDVTLEPGWNLVSVELGKTVQAKRAESVEGVQLEVFGR
jgi:hypothetical protein